MRCRRSPSTQLPAAGTVRVHPYGVGRTGAWATAIGILIIGGIISIGGMLGAPGNFANNPGYSPPFGEGVLGGAGGPAGSGEPTPSPAPTPAETGEQPGFREPGRERHPTPHGTPGRAAHGTDHVRSGADTHAGQDALPDRDPAPDGVTQPDRNADPKPDPTASEPHATPDGDADAGSHSDPYARAHPVTYADARTGFELRRRNRQ